MKKGDETLRLLRILYFPHLKSPDESVPFVDRVLDDLRGRAFGQELHEAALCHEPHGPEMQRTIGLKYSPLNHFGRSIPSPR